MLTIFAIGFMIVFGGFFERSIRSHRFNGNVSDHFDGDRFFNTPPTTGRHPDRNNQSVWKWMLTRSRGEWKKVSVIPVVPAQRVHDGVVVTYINHATILIQCDGVNIITDPVFSYRASPLPFLGPARYADPGVRLKDLPPIDIVLLSHNHYDHMDLASLRVIHRAHKPRIYTGLGNAAYLSRKGIPGAHEMDWWDTATDGALSISAVPARHFSARSIGDRNHTLWCGFVVQTKKGNIYFSGDTGYGDFVHSIAERFAPFSLALIPIGAYDPAWMMQAVHTNPEEAIQMHDILRSAHSIGIHHGTFRLTDEPQEEPKERLEAGRGERSFSVLQNGGSVSIEG